MKPTLLIIAAGMGSRYGGLKQIDPVGPNGEVIIQAGFKKVVFVIRHSFEEAFREKIGSKLDGVVETAYAHQELDLCLDGFPLPDNREKPWGTGHAILVAKDVIDDPFAVINADDYYGPHSYRLMKEQLEAMGNSENGDYSMSGYVLRNTLSEYGTVARGVCQCDEQMYLAKVTERVGIKKLGDGASCTDENGNELSFTGNEIVSMNLWGFKPSIFGHLQQQFNDYLEKHASQNKSEFYIPMAVDDLISSGQRKVKVLATDDNWFGVTYHEDKAIAQESINELIGKGVYPERLWS